MNADSELCRPGFTWRSHVGRGAHAWALTVLLLASCSSDAGDGAPAATDNGDTTEDASGTADGSPDVVDVEWSVPDDTDRTSYVSAYSYSFGGIQTSNVTAGFYDQSPGQNRALLEVAAPGCEVVRVQLDGNTGFPVFVNAGTLTIAGGEQVVTLPYESAGYAGFGDGEQALYTGGETLTFTSDGGTDVPAFEATLTAPSHTTVTAPVLLPGQPLAVDRSSDLEVAWATGPSVGEIRVTLAGPQLEGESATYITCYWPVDSGTGTIPSAALNELPAGTGTLSVSGISRTTRTVEGWGPIGLSAEMPALNENGAQFNTSVALE